MLEPDSKAQVPQWRQRKKAQWHRIRNKVPGLQMVEYGEDRSTFMLTYSVEGTYESIIFGRLPVIYLERTGVRGQDIRNAMEAKKPEDKQSIDLNDQQLDMVVKKWSTGRSALELPYAKSVWKREGRARRERTK